MNRCAPSFFLTLFYSYSIILHFIFSNFLLSVCLPRSISECSRYGWKIEGQMSECVIHAYRPRNRLRGWSTIKNGFWIDINQRSGKNEFYAAKLIIQLNLQSVHVWHFWTWSKGQFYLDWNQFRLINSGPNPTWTEHCSTKATCHQRYEGTVHQESYYLGSNLWTWPKLNFVDLFL